MFGISDKLTLVLAAVIAAASVFAAGYWKGYSGEKEKFDAYKVEVQTIAKAQEENTKRIIESQKQITQKAEKQHEKDVSSLRAIYDRLRKSTSSSAVSAVPDTTANPAEATAYYLAVAPELATQCGETTQQVVSLQNWINDQLQANK
jgi:hypothetical protein